MYFPGKSGGGAARVFVLIVLSVCVSLHVNEQEISRAKCTINAVKSHTVVSSSKPKWTCKVMH